MENILSLSSDSLNVELIKVNSLFYKTKINVKVKPKIKITYVLILSIFLVSEKIEQKYWIQDYALRVLE